MALKFDKDKITKLSSEIFAALTFNVMGEVGAFEADFVDRLSKMARFRNRLVHIYWEVADELVYSILGEHIKDMERFTECIMVFFPGEKK